MIMALANHDSNGNDGGSVRSTESGRADLVFWLVKKQLIAFSVIIVYCIVYQAIGILY